MSSNAESWLRIRLIPVVLLAGTALIAVPSLVRYVAIRPMPSESLAIRSSPIRLHASLYDRCEPAKVNAAVVLLHSSNPLARHMPFNRIVAQRLSERVPVLSADLRGWGDSGLSGHVNRVEDLDFATDLSLWIKLLATRYGISEQRVVLVGRGTGAAAIVQYLHRYPEARHAVVLIVPPRGQRIGAELYSNAESPLLKRWHHDMSGPWRVQLSVMQELSNSLRLESLPTAQHGRHITLVDTPATMETPLLREVFGDLVEPKQLYAVGNGIDHYFGTRLPGSVNDRLTRTFGPRSWLLYRPRDLDHIECAVLGAVANAPQ